MSRIVEQIIGINHQLNEEKSTEKLKQTVVCYVTPEVVSQGQPNEKPGCRCGKCAFFTETTSECGLTSPAKCSAEHGVCSLFLGRPKSGSVVQKAHSLIPKKAVGYLEDKAVPTRCGNCGYYGKAPGDPTGGGCRKIDGQIFEDGCCNAWESIEEEKREQAEEA